MTAAQHIPPPGRAAGAEAMLQISQVFGPTVQGEGAAAGRHCLFVRTFGCNLECAWCDTAYTWAVTDEKAAKTRDGHRYERDAPAYGRKFMTPADVLERLRGLWDIETRPTVIVVSGGEPMMQQRELLPLLEWLRGWGHEVHVETAGTIAPRPEFDRAVTQYNVSPKLKSSGNPVKKRHKPAVLDALRDTGRAWFKFVVTSDVGEDLAEVDGIVAEAALSPQRVMVMPEGSDARTNIATAQQMVDAAVARGYGISFRTQVLLWDEDPDR